MNWIKFNLAQAAELTPEGVGVQPGNMLVPVSTYYALYHLEAALRRAKTPRSGNRGAARAIAAARGIRGIRSGAGPTLQHHRADTVHESAVDGGEGRQAGAAGSGSRK